MSRLASPSLVLALALALGCSSSHAPDASSIGLMRDAGFARRDAGGGNFDGGSVRFDGGVVPGPDAGPTPDAGPRPDAGAPVTVPDGGGPGLIACMGTYCDAASEECCITFMGGASGTCIPAGGTCMGGAVGCDAPTDCAAGEVCCGRFSGISLAIACEPASEMCGQAGITSGLEVCEQDSDCTTAGDRCCTFNGGGFRGGVCNDMCFGGP